MPQAMPQHTEKQVSKGQRFGVMCQILAVCVCRGDEPGDRVGVLAPEKTSSVWTMGLGLVLGLGD